MSQSGPGIFLTNNQRIDLGLFGTNCWHESVIKEAITEKYGAGNYYVEGITWPTADPGPIDPDAEALSK